MFTKNERTGKCRSITKTGRATGRENKNVDSEPKARQKNGNETSCSNRVRLEINKKIIQEKQGKDKPERGADLGVRTV